MWDQARQRIAQHLGHPVTLEIEPGRFLVAQSGVLVSEVRGTKWMGNRHFTLVDAGFSDLMRPALYGSYHHISVMPAEGGAADTRPLQPTLVAGPLCESGDVFTQLAGGDVEPRPLPLPQVGDYLVFHDTGAYGASMSSNYNSRPLIPEVLLDQGRVIEIRRRQRLDELLALEQAQPLFG
jgi:diaminopimelate decarboxylase (EC 4.1.1.20)